MKQTHSRSFAAPARVSLATACALLIGATAALAQTTGASSSPSGTSTNTDRYGTGTSSSTRADRSGTQSDQSTSGSAVDSTERASSDRSSSSPSGTTYGTSGRDRSTTTDTTASTTDTSMSGKKLSWGDRRFVTKAADHGMTEQQLAKLAAERATNPEVKSYAQKLVQDHEKVHSELQSLASQKNVKLDDEDGKDRTYRRLSNKSGQEFDEEFVHHMVEMHEDDVKMFEKAANDAKDSELRSFASKHVDSLRQHLQEAQSLRQSIMPTGRSDSSSGRSSSDTSTRSDTSSSTGSSTSSRSSDFGNTDASGAPKTGSASGATPGSSSSSDTKPRP